MSYKYYEKYRLKEIKELFEEEKVITRENGSWLITQAELVEELNKEIEELKEYVKNLENERY